MGEIAASHILQFSIFVLEDLELSQECFLVLHQKCPLYYKGQCARSRRRQSGVKATATFVLRCHNEKSSLKFFLSSPSLSFSVEAFLNLPLFVVLSCWSDPRQFYFLIMNLCMIYVKGENIKLRSHFMLLRTLGIASKIGLHLKAKRSLAKHFFAFIFSFH